jgi:hypothetical protein
MVKSRRMRWAGHVACMGKRQGAYGFLVGKSKRKRPLGKRKILLEDNIKIDLQEVEWGTWTRLIWLRIGTGDEM